jgi:uncharacterized OB-fold protein
MRIPIVDYLVLDGDEPRLRAHECGSCGARYLDHRNGCAACGSLDPMATVALAPTGTVRTFTIVHRASHNVPTPYVSVVVDLDGGGDVKATLRSDPDPKLIPPGLRVRLVTFEAGTDDDGNVAVAFAFEPLEVTP